MSPESQKFFDDVLAILARQLFDRKLISNNVRPLYVEQMIASLLGDGWKVVGSDWGGYDIEGPNKLKIEVKQSAARQTWSDRESLKKKGVDRFTKGSFDVALRPSRFEQGGMIRLKNEGRPANVYIFAWHGVTDEKTADHRDVSQWHFYVVPTRTLDERIGLIRKRVSLVSIKKFCEGCTYKELRSAVIAAISP
jgi:hypothetical protein